MDNSIYKKCTECGQTKHISEFSKSYPNRCKTCVAEHTRQMRAAEKLKAKVKATGEVIDVEPSGTMQVLCGSFITKDGRRMPGTALEFEKAIDWEQRRYEIAKEIMKGFSANSHNQCVDASSETLAQWSISGPDELDAELCIKDGMNYQIAEIHLGDVESSNILCKEIARRWNEFEEWHECKENTEDAPERNTPCLLRTECKEITTGIVEVGYLTSVWGEYGWTEDYLDDFDESEFEVTITHWKPINKPKGVEE